MRYFKNFLINIIKTPIKKKEIKIIIITLNANINVLFMSILF